MYGFLLYGFGPALDALREELDVSRAAIGTAGSAMAAGGIAASLVARRTLAVAGAANALRACLALMVVGAGVLIIASHAVLAAVAGACIGAGGGLLLVTVPVLVERRQPLARAAVLAEANAAAATAGVAAPLAVGGATLAGLGWETGIAVGIPAALVLALLVGRTGLGRGTTGEEPHHASAGGLPATYFRWVATLVTVVGIEFCIVFWAPDYLQEQTGMRQGTAGASLGVFVAGMALGRITGGRLAVHRRPEQLLAGGLSLALCGLALFWAAVAPAVSVAGLFVTGCGISVLYPMALSLAMRAAPANPQGASVVASVGAGTSILVAPFALAAAGDAIGIRPAFTLVFALAVAGLLLTLTAPHGAEA
ncbi:MAG: MFS transporter [Thermoleophilia bacterium]|nr:MFS transporter [Thermoleophilia bacterium]